jgi:UDP-GlcNAc3NAcA epimerase
MSDVFFTELGMARPRYQLNVHGGSHGEMTGRMLGAVERVILDERPDAVLVFGDTNSTLAGALAAVKLHVPVAHVEAGLRSFNMAMPEEINRILTDRISRWLFTPTVAADSHLKSEGVDPARIVNVGDVMHDVARHFGAKVRDRAPLAGNDLLSGDYVLTTVHRAENTNDATRLDNIIDGLRAVSTSLPVVWPVHPRTKELLASKGIKADNRLRLIDPVGYLDMVSLESHAAVIATDSGGVQKEAFFHSVPCVTLRTETEWTELVDAGWNRITPPTSSDAISTAILSARGRKGMPITPYGKGDAAEKVVSTLARGINGS